MAKNNYKEEQKGDKKNSFNNLKSAQSILHKLKISGDLNDVECAACKFIVVDPLECPTCQTIAC